MLARICKLEFPALNPILIFPALGAFNVAPIFSKPLVPEEYAMPILFFIFFAIYCYFIVSIIIQFAVHLGINVFTIPYPPPEVQAGAEASAPAASTVPKSPRGQRAKEPKVPTSPKAVASPKAKAPTSPKATRKPKKD